MGGGDDLVAGADAQRLERQVQAGGAELTAIAMFDARSPRIGAEAPLELLRPSGPVVSQPERSVSTTSAISSSPMSGRAKGRKAGVMGATSLPGAA